MKKLSTISLMIFCFFSVYSQTPDTLFAHYSVNQCDSLIQANENNPDFVIMDVRQPEHYIPEHLTGAINRDYYSPYFSSWIDALPRHKFYLLYCQSGGRSGNTFNMMAGMDFTMVVNMLGGIIAWNNAGFYTTSAFAPLLMSVSDTIVTMDTIPIGTIDTIALTITNRANDTLGFYSISSLTGTEFSTSFDTTTKILGAEDYTFAIYYEPFDEVSDSISFLIESNGGDVTYSIERTGLFPAGVRFSESQISGFKFLIYPNPAIDKLNISADGYPIDEVRVYTLTGQQLMCIKPSNGIMNISTLQSGMYIVEVTIENRKLRQKLLVQR